MASKQNKPRLTWNPRTAKRNVREHIRRGVIQGAQFARAEIVERLSESQPIKSLPSGPVGLDPSEPWGDPKMVTGDYRRSISVRRAVNPREIRASIFANDHKAARLEFGFIGTDAAGRKIEQAPRPTIRRTLHQKREKIIEIMRRGGR